MMKTNKRDSTLLLKRIMAYVIMPLFFSVLGYALIYAMTFEYVDIAIKIGSTFISADVRDFDEGLDSIYSPKKTTYPTYVRPSVSPTPNITQEPDITSAPVITPTLKATEVKTESGVTLKPTVMETPKGTPLVVTGAPTPKATAVPTPTPTAKPTSTYTVPISEIEIPRYNTRYGQITCEEAYVDAPLFWGDSESVLNNGIGQAVSSFLPGRGRPILVSGHNGTYFYGLRNMKVGYIVTIQTNYGLYQYEVFEIRIARYDDQSAYNLLENNETLIMYTCYPHDLLSYTKNERKFVYARKVIGPDWDWSR